MFRRSIILLSLAVFGLLLGFNIGNAQVPHTVIGQVNNSDATVPAVGELSWEAHLVDISNGNAHSETRTEGDPGNAYGDGIMGSGWFEVECGNFTAFEWSNGDSLVIAFSNSANGETGCLAVVLSSIQEPQIAQNVTLDEAQPAWDISVDDDPDPVWAGDDLIYTIDFQNTGQGAASGVTIVDTIPAHTSYISNTGGGSYDGQRVIWSLGAIPPSGSGTVSLRVTVDSPLANGTPISNTARIACSQGVDGAGSQSTTVHSIPVWSFLLSDSPDPVTAGEYLTYTILYQNTGTDQAIGATVVDTIPAHASYASNTGGGLYDGQRVTWSLGSVPAGASGSLSLTVAVDWPLPNGSQINNAAHITCNQGVTVEDEQTTQVSPDLDPPTAVSDLMSAMQAGELRLSWSAILTDIYGEPEAVDGYIIYRHQTPYFTPSPVDSIAVVADTFYIDPGSHAGDGDANTFYVLRGVDHAGNIGDISNQVGEIDYQLPYATSGYTLVSNSLDDAITSQATELGAQVPNCTAVKVWDAAERGYVSRAFKVGDTWYGSADIISGYPYYLFISSSTESVWTLAGQVPEDPVFQLQAPTGNDYNTITLPLSSDIALAKELGASISHCTAVKRWDENTQGYVSIAFKVGEMWFGNAVVRPGYPYYVNVTAGSTWPTGKMGSPGPIAQKKQG